MSLPHDISAHGRRTGKDYVDWVLGAKRPATWRGETQFLRVLCIDGGGIRGVIPAVMLDRMEQRTGKPVSELFDIIAGTSTGGLLSLGLTYPSDGAGWTTWPQRPKYSAADILAVYREHGSTIFGRRKRHMVRSVMGLRRPQYETSGLEGLFEDLFGDAKMRDAIRHTLLTMYDSERRQPYPINSSTQAAEARKRGRGYDLLMRDVARATSAAPTYFAPHKIAVGDTHLSALDGGVAANNPALYGLIEAQARAGDSSLLLVSLGTGEHPEQFQYARIRKWGMVSWVRPIIELLSSAGSATTHQQLNFMVNGVLPRLGANQYQTGLEAGGDGYDVNRDHEAQGRARRWSRYLRYQPRLEAASPAMDDASRDNIHALQQDAERHLAEHAEDFNLLCDFLVDAAAAKQVSYPDWDDSDPRKEHERAGR